MKYFKLIQGTVDDASPLMDMSYLSVKVSAPNLNAGMKKMASYISVDVGIPRMTKRPPTYIIYVTDSASEAHKPATKDENKYVMEFHDNSTFKGATYTKMISNRPSLGFISYNWSKK